MPGPLIAFLIQLAIALIINAVAYILAPKPKGPKPEEVAQLENPTAEAGKPLSVVFGTMWVQEVNILWYGDKSSKTYKVKV